MFNSNYRQYTNRQLPLSMMLPENWLFLKIQSRHTNCLQFTVLFLGALVVFLFIDVKNVEVKI